MIYIRLFLAFLEVGAFAFGGGYAALPLIEQVVVSRHGWMTLREMTDIIAISQVTPGPIALNAATFVGTRVAGIPGAVIASVAAVLPQTVFLLFLGWFMFHGGRITLIKRALKGLRPGVAGLIAIAALSMFMSSLFPGSSLTAPDYVAAAAFVLAVFMRFKKMDVTRMIFAGAGIGLIGGLIEHLAAGR